MMSVATYGWAPSNGGADAAAAAPPPCWEGEEGGSMSAPEIEPFGYDNERGVALPQDATGGSREGCADDNSACVTAVTPGPSLPSTTPPAAAAMLVPPRPPRDEA